ncbi:uncharacterized protein LOC127282338 [Leptopilina boulardi]|uniref:uncharacterized protein LOC127282338 n=1 Tax=Leptopilina boulardi TaxID=63433 RepID=UPI0021F552A0|nr:uncharacterized protein LOC127282338 [Leptopilina boulardi]
MSANSSSSNASTEDFGDFCINNMLPLPLLIDREIPHDRAPSDRPRVWSPGKITQLVFLALKLVQLSREERETTGLLGFSPNFEVRNAGSKSSGKMRIRRVRNSWSPHFSPEGRRSSLFLERVRVEQQLQCLLAGVNQIPAGRPDCLHMSRADTCTSFQGQHRRFCLCGRLLSITQRATMCKCGTKFEDPRMPGPSDSSVKEYIPPYKVMCGRQCECGKYVVNEFRVDKCSCGAKLPYAADATEYFNPRPIDLSFNNTDIDVEN